MRETKAAVEPLGPVSGPPTDPTVRRASRPTREAASVAATPASNATAGSVRGVTGTPFDGASSPARAEAAMRSSARGLADLPAEQLQAEIVVLSQRLSAGTYELLVLVGELDERGTWAAWGSLTCAAWLAEACDVEIATARTQVRVARAIRRHEALDAAMRSGDVSYAKARVLVPVLSDENVEPLVDLARETPAGRLGVRVAAWLQGHEDADAIAARQHRERSVSWRTGPDGMVVITARLPPAEGGRVCAVIDTAVTRSGAPAGAGGDRDPRAETASRATLGQMRADALVEVVTSGGSGVEVEVVVHVRGGDEPCTLADGTPLGDHALAALLPDAFVSLLAHDMAGHPIDASPRRRHPTRRQRRVLDERSATCEHPGCTARAFLQYDHIRRYTDGGPTVLDNLRRLCGPHNRARESKQQARSA